MRDVYAYSGANLAQGLCQLPPVFPLSVSVPFDLMGQKSDEHPLQKCVQCTNNQLNMNEQG